MFHNASVMAVGGRAGSPLHAGRDYWRAAPCRGLPALPAVTEALTMFHKFPLIYMKNCIVSLRPLSLVILLACALAARAQAPDNPPSPDGGPPPGMDFPPPDGPPGFDGPPPFGPDGFGPGGPGPGGPGGMTAEKKLVKQFDKNGDGWLNREERKA